MKILVRTLLLMGAVGVTTAGVVNAQAVGGVCTSQGGSMSIQSPRVPPTVTTVSNNGVGTTGTIVTPPSHVDTIPPIITTPTPTPTPVQVVPNTPPVTIPNTPPDLGPPTPTALTETPGTPTPTPPVDTTPTPPTRLVDTRKPGTPESHPYIATNPPPYEGGEYKPPYRGTKQGRLPRHPRHYHMPKTGGDASMIPLLGLAVTGGMFGLRRRMLKAQKNS